jgi:hypothetical protein
VLHLVYGLDQRSVVEHVEQSVDGLSAIAWTCSMW